MSVRMSVRVSTISYIPTLTHLVAHKHTHTHSCTHMHTRKQTHTRSLTHSLTRSLTQIDVVVGALTNPAVLGNHEALEMALSAMDNLTAGVTTLSKLIALGAHKVMGGFGPHLDNKGLGPI